MSDLGVFCHTMIGLAAATSVETKSLPDGTRVVVMRVEHAAGATIFSLSPDNAEQVAEHLVASARAARGSTLVVPRIVPRHIPG